MSFKCLMPLLSRPHEPLPRVYSLGHKNAHLRFLRAEGSKDMSLECELHDTIATSTVCGTCKSILEEGLKFEKGVIRVTVLVEEKKIILKYRTDKTD